MKKTMLAVAFLATIGVSSAVELYTASNPCRRPQAPGSVRTGIPLADRGRPALT
jgi:hypothetical protein